MYEINERVILFGEWKWGNIIQSYIGATNVGSINIKYDSTFKSNSQEGPLVSRKLIGEEAAAGEEIGKFLMGSSVLAIVEVPNDFKWEVHDGQKVVYGMRLGY